MKKIGVLLILLVILPICFAQSKIIVEGVTESGGVEQAVPLRTGSDASEKNYVYGNGLVASVKDGEVNYHHQDIIHSNSIITDNNGEVVYSGDFLPYGYLFNSIGENDYGFSNKELDDTGLNYFVARYYDSTIGKFISVDPLMSGHAYAYVSNNPKKYVDPSGMADESTDSTFIESPYYESSDEVIEKLGFDPTIHVAIFTEDTRIRSMYDPKEKPLPEVLLWNYGINDFLPWASFQVPLMYGLGESFPTKANTVLSYITNYGTITSIGLLLTEKKSPQVKGFYDKLDYIKTLTNDPEERIAMAFGLVKNTFEWDASAIAVLSPLNRALIRGKGSCKAHAQALETSIDYLLLDLGYKDAASVVHFPGHARTSIHYGDVEYDLDASLGFYEVPTRLQPVNEEYFMGFYEHAFIRNKVSTATSSPVAPRKY